MFMRRLLDSVVVVAVHGVFFLCFFFKQKTAYEMRISDWSSDVCSSDLFAQGTYAIGPQTNITVGARYTNEKKTSDPNNYFIDIGYGLGPLSIGNPNPNPATIIDTPVAVKFNNVSHMATIDHRWSSSIMTYATRSEEHTSELQPIMRISYAVFSLKKKKHNHTTHHTHQYHYMH